MLGLVDAHCRPTTPDHHVCSLLVQPDSEADPTAAAVLIEPPWSSPTKDELWRARADGLDLPRPLLRSRQRARTTSGESSHHGSSSRSPTRPNTAAFLLHGESAGFYDASLQKRQKQLEIEKRNMQLFERLSSVTTELSKLNAGGTGEYKRVQKLIRSRRNEQQNRRLRQSERIARDNEVRERTDRLRVSLTPTHVVLAPRCRTGKAAYVARSK